MSERSYVIIGILCFILGILFFIYDTISVMLSTGGAEIQRMTDQTDWYKKQNILLKEEVLQNEALTTIDEKARKAGFENAKYLYFK